MKRVTPELIADLDWQLTKRLGDMTLDIITMVEHPEDQAEIALRALETVIAFTIAQVSIAQGCVKGRHPIAAAEIAKRAGSQSDLVRASTIIVKKRVAKCLHI